MSQAGRLGTGTPVPPGSGIQTLTGNTGSPTGPDAFGNVDILGSSVITTNSNPLTNTVTIALTAATDGQLIIGATAGNPAWANLTSILGTVVITNGPNSINLEAPGGGAANLFQEDVGTAAPLAGLINVFGGNNINTVGDNAHTITINLNNDITVHDLTVTDDVTFSSFNPGVLVVETAGVVNSTNGTDGQILIASSLGDTPTWNNITSIDGSVTITNGHHTIDLSVLSSHDFVAKISADVGAPAIPDINNEIEILGGSNINTAANGPLGNVITVNLDDNVTIPGFLTVNTLSPGVVQTGGFALFSNKGTNGQILISSTAGVPAWANIISLGGTVAITNGPNLISLDISGTVVTSISADVGSPAVPIGNEFEILGGSNINTTANGPAGNTITVALNDDVTIPGFLTVNTLSPGVVQTGGFALFSNKGTDGQVLISSTAGVPAWANITPGANINIVNGPNSITISSSGGVSGQDAFLAYLPTSTGAVTGDGTLYTLGTTQAFTIVFDDGGNVSAGGGGNPVLFTAPATGRYFIQYQVQMVFGFTGVGSNLTTYSAYIVTPTQAFSTTPGISSAQQTAPCLSISTVVNLTIGDTVTFAAMSSGNGLNPKDVVIVGSATSPFNPTYRTWISGNRVA